MEKKTASLIPPVKLADNLYWVGVKHMAPAHLLKTSEGIVLIDTASDDTVDELIKNIESLGFDIRDVKHIVHSHGHYDHTGATSKIVALSGAMFVASFVVAGLNFRYGWHTLPEWVVWLAVGLFLLSYLLYAEVVRENAYLSRTIEVQAEQKVIDTGLYGIVRHPMYAATLLLFLSMPLILGSLISFIITLAYIPIISIRISNEEQVLEEGLAGYKEYKQRVKYKVIPYVW